MAKGLTKAGQPRKRAARKDEGRPTKYDPKYCDLLIKYFDIEFSREKEILHTGKGGSEWTDYKIVPNTIRFLKRFADSIGIPRQTLYKWEKENKEFRDALTRAREMREEMIAANALEGLYNPQFSMFYLKNRYADRYVDKTEVKADVTFKKEQGRILQRAKQILKEKLSCKE